MCIYFYMFKLQSPSKYSIGDGIHLSRYFFSTAQNSFWTHRFLMPFSASAVFCFTSSTSAKCFHLRTSSFGKQRKSYSGDIGWIGRVGHRGHAIFGQKLPNTQRDVGRCVLNLPSRNGQMPSESSKKFTEAKCSLSQHHQLVYWYKWVSKTFT